MAHKTIPIIPVEEIENHLYEKRQKIYPREVHGIFAKLRIAAVVTLLGLYYGIAWLQWNDRQAVLFDLPARKFYVFGQTFWPQDFFYLTLLLIFAALALFFFTTLAGRLWCGYACPQTVWTETFLWIERLVEGSRSQQIKLDKAKGSRNTIVRKTIKHALWIVFSLWTGFTFVGYFTPIRELGLDVLALSVTGWSLFWILFYSFATYGNAGWMREQVCLHMCPYARFQSSMFDKNTLIISYDKARGEPRGKLKAKAAAPTTAGDCIDCTLCFQVCPTGIDIREGLQYECIGCAACIDACDEVMEKTNKPKGLIRYTTENALEGNPVRLLRPRVIIYATVLLVLLSVLIYSITQRKLVDIDVIRDRNALYRELDDGTIENTYTLKILNKTEQPQRFRLTATGLDGLILQSDENMVDVDSGAVKDLVVRLQTHYEQVPATSNQVEFHIASESDPDLFTQEPARFLAPQMDN